MMLCEHDCASHVIAIVVVAIAVGCRITCNCSCPGPSMVSALEYTRLAITTQPAYPANLNCTAIIAGGPAPGAAVALDFGRVAFQNANDVVEIRAGSNASAPLVVMTLGQELQGQTFASGV
jgi:hypothetical protein